MSQRDEDDEERHSCPSGVTGDQGRFLTKVGLYFNHVCIMSNSQWLRVFAVKGILSRAYVRPSMYDPRTKQIRLGRAARVGTHSFVDRGGQP